MKKGLAALALVTLLAGCKPKPEQAVAPPIATNPKTTTQAPTPPPATGPANPPASVPSETKDTLDTPPPPAPLSSIPPELKTAAYDYYGLEAKKPIDYELSGDGVGGILTGSQTTSLKEVKDGKAYFTQVRSGGLSKEGEDEVSIDAAGVHVVSAHNETVDPDNLEFPSDVSVGKTWKSHDKTTQPDITFDLNTVSTIKGVRSLTTKRGTLQALLVISKSEGTQGGKQVSIDIESYYVKGIGLAKAIFKTKVGSEKPQTIVQQLAD